MNKILIILLLFFAKTIAQRPTFLLKDSIKSTLDLNTQFFFYDKSSLKSKQPLVVELHSWSNTAQSQTDIVAEIVHNKQWNYILPNFRGVNNHPKACVSDFVISDIDETIDWAIQHMNVDKNNIYVVGNSGGGMATLAMYMKSRHKIKTFSAWSAISNLEQWYHESIERKNRYGPEICLCTGAGTSFDSKKASERSPINWQTPVKRRKRSQLQIYAGIHDGYTGSVPISHAIAFFNKIVADFKSGKAVTETEANEMISTRNFNLKQENAHLGDRMVHYKNATKRVVLTIFEGGHEILRQAAVDRF